MNPIHITIMGYLAVVGGLYIIYQRAKPGEKFTKYTVLQITLLFTFAVMSVTGLTEIILPKLIEGVKAWAR